MTDKILESIGLIVLNVIGICVGIILGLIFIQNLGSTQDNHFLGGIFSLIEIIIRMIIGIVLGVGSTTLITVVYIIARNRKKR